MDKHTPGRRNDHALIDLLNLWQSRVGGRRDWQDLLDKVQQNGKRALAKAGNDFRHVKTAEAIQQTAAGYTNGIAQAANNKPNAGNISTLATTNPTENTHAESSASDQLDAATAEVESITTTINEP